MDKFETLKLYLAGIFLEPNFGVERITKFICDVDAHGMTGWSPSPYQFRLFPKRAGLVPKVGQLPSPAACGCQPYMALNRASGMNILLAKRA